LVTVGEAVGVDLRVQAADQKVIEISERVLTAFVDAAGVGDGLTQRKVALL
jgi:hypothetical protein